VGCHTAQGFLNQVAPNANYVEKVASTAQITTANALPLVCATCHDPHGSSNNTHQLRFSIGAANVDDNLCIKCHQRRADPSQVTTRNSVHSPEGPTLLGLAGWFPPGMSAGDSIIGTHGTPSRNPQLCATCHVARFTGTDKATGAVTQATGHRFIATPCVDAAGIPTVAQSCAISARTFRSCASSTCHASETVARTLFITDSTRIQQLVASANSAIAKVKVIKPADCTLGGPKYTSCLGTQFNVSLALSPGNFVHNPFLLEQLLVASINQLQKEYGISPDIAVSLDRHFVMPAWRRASAAPSP
jgi:predicted CXXCH cytochrome family protein